MPKAQPRKWLDFASTDLQMAELGLQHGLFEPVCFHAQQVVEKSLKAFLLQETGAVPHIHSLPALLARCEKSDATMKRFKESCKQLDQFYTPMRYPDMTVGTSPSMPTKADAEGALKAAKEI
jgi:HEPN domain-containing protein